MPSAVMAVQDDSGGAPSNTMLTKDAIGNDHAPKGRKPYTITKQRERWTDEEHKRFLEALKLFGRAWRRIEEHVGTKTAVQIRSHAQKFFSKVVRESNGSDENLLKPTDIPPPRPKRQAMRPYPRKLVPPVKIGIPLQEQQSNLASPNLSVLEQENQSPTSVLSAIGSDTVTDSNMPNDGQSPVSSAADVISGGCILSEPIISLVESGYSFAAQADGHSDEQVPLKLELFTKVDAFTEGGLADESSSKCLKLFGQTVIISDSRKQSSATSRTWQKLPSNSMPMKFSAGNLECVWSVPSFGAPAAVHYTPFLDNCNPVEAVSAVLPWWTPTEDASLLSIQLYNPVRSKLNPFSNDKGTCDNDVEKRGSLASSNSGSPNSNGNWGVETNSSRSCLEMDNEEGSPLLFKAGDKIGLRERREGTEKVLKGFVPYKRCLAERATQSSIIAVEENEKKRICLGL